MKHLDLSRLVAFDLKTALPIAGSANKTISGVCSHPIVVYAQLIDDVAPVVYAVLQPGRFTFDVHVDRDCAVTFKSDSANAEMAILWPEQPTKLFGDPENSWTKVGHRPSINPEMQAVMLQMRQMQMSMAVMASDAERANQRQAMADKAAAEKAAADKAAADKAAADAAAAAAAASS